MLIVFLSVVVAQAQVVEQRVRVEWVAPEGCPDRSEWATSLESSVPSNRTFFGSVRIDEPREVDQPWRSVVVTSVDGQQRTRVVEGTDCARVTEAAVLVVTLAATSMKEPVPEPLPVRHAFPEAPEKKAETAERAEPGQSGDVSWRFRIQPHVSANVGVFPTPWLGAGAALLLQRQRLLGELAVTQWFRHRSTNISTDLVSAKLKGCLLFEPTRGMRLGPCLAGEVGVLSFEGTNIAAPARIGQAWGAAMGGVTFGVNIAPRIQGWVGVEVGTNVVAPRVSVTTLTEPVVLRRMGWPMGRITVGIDIESN